MRNDEAIVLAAVQQNGSALYYASDAMRNNAVVVMAAMQDDARALHGASDDLRNERWHNQLCKHHSLGRLCGPQH